MAFRRPRISALNRQVELQDHSQVADGSDGLDDTWTVVATVPARVIVLFGGRIVDSVNTTERASHVFTIRYRSDAGSGAWDHLEMEGRRFRVVSVMDPDEGHVWLELLAEEVKRGI